jgi:hypothetical protein
MHKFGLLIALALLPGCATLFGESTQMLQFTSKPEGAAVILNGVPIGQTPLTYSIDRETFQRHQVVVSMEGYEPRHFELTKGLNPIAILNLSSLLSWVTDAATGNMIQYSPGAYYLELAPAYGGAPGAQLDRPDRAALWFVLVTHHALLTQIARGDGEYLRALADLLHVDREVYSLFVRDLQSRADRLLAHDYPHHLYQDLAVTSDRYRTPASLALPAVAEQSAR